MKQKLLRIRTNDHLMLAAKRVGMMGPFSVRSKAALCPGRNVIEMAVSGGSQLPDSAELSLLVEAALSAALLAQAYSMLLLLTFKRTCKYPLQPHPRRWRRLDFY
jgi:hypothetical protein